MASLAMANPDTMKAPAVPETPAAPKAPKPQQQPLALAGSVGGQASTQQPLSQPTGQTADPLAFAPNTNPVPQTPSTLPMNQSTSGGIAPPPVPATAMSYDDFINYSPNAGKSEAEKAAALEANASVLGRAPIAFGGYQVANTPTGEYGANNVAKYTQNPEAIAQLNALAAADTTGARQANALTAANAGEANVNRELAVADAARNINSRTTTGGTGTADEIQALRDRFMAEDGFDAGGNFVGEPANNPGATMGGPTRSIAPSDRPNTNPLPDGGSTAVVNPPSATNPTNPLSYATSEINPDDSLLSKVITPGAGVDRYQQALDQLANYKQASDSRFKADARDLNRYNFGAGRGVSGAARTSQGDLLSERQNDLDTKGFEFLNNALTGSIGDSYRNIDEAQQERDFQRGERDTAFSNEERQALLKDQLINSDFGRNQARQQAGYADSPEQIQLILSSIFGDQSSAAGKAAAQAFANAGKGSSGGGSNNYLQILKDIYDRFRGGGSPDGGYVDTPVDDGREVA